MSAAPLDDRINARAQLEHVARGPYADPTAALRAIRHDAHTMGADAVRQRLEQDFTHYGEAGTRAQGPAHERVQMVLREGGIAADVGRWLTLDHTPAGPRLVRDGEIERVMQAPDAETLGRNPTDAPWPSPGIDPREGLTAEERLAYEQVEAYAEARERADQRHAAEARLHAIHDHRANLAAAETNIPRAEAALKTEVEGVFTDHAKALQRIEDAIERDGPVETARRIRSGDGLGIGIVRSDLGAEHLPERDPAARRGRFDGPGTGGAPGAEAGRVEVRDGEAVPQPSAREPRHARVGAQPADLAEDRLAVHPGRREVGLEAAAGELVHPPSLHARAGPHPAQDRQLAQVRAPREREHAGERAGRGGALPHLRPHAAHAE